MMTPGGANGLESLFRTMGVSLDENDKVPDLNQPVEHLLEEIKGLEKIKNSSQPSVAHKLKIPVNYLSQP